MQASQRFGGAVLQNYGNASPAANHGWIRQSRRSGCTAANARLPLVLGWFLLTVYQKKTY
jgi:hypothetical protein